ncbi:PE-PPE domain-containing protein [Nocardia sp. NBC_00565]|uniref:PE-PPE domain-containing protein n=1 Tax=Nocardia sp. NBC_00565 TaxID=2975993 RepID=UPI002E80CFFB|nr:PE-PPE domain-containing protein [Nocardia sp. NBC_00565]WUC03670.1 PE-PPE domain-containing protein [Nocardia sp. NBC_00565]
MTTYSVLWLPGTGFSTGPDLISSTFGAALDPYRFQFESLRYPASYGSLEMSFAESKAVGRQILIDAIRATPYRAILGGYSQGAGIAGSLAAEIGRGEHPDLEVAACALIADPARPAGAGMPDWPVASGYGIAGQRPVDGVPTWWAANEGDPICALPVGNPLRTLADVSEYYSLRSPGDARQWMEKLLERASQNRWQRWWSIENVRSWGGAVAYARGYLLDGRHTGDYIGRGHAVRLAQVVNEAVG